MTVEILPATADRFDDAEHALTGGGDGATCQCQWWVLTNARFSETSREERERMLRAQLDAHPAPALIAYVDGEAAGWVRVGPRIDLPRLLRTRAVTAHTAEPLDDPGVWAVSCFVVRKEFRGRGLGARLLDAAVAHAREGGARVVEAYPVDPDSAPRKTGVNELYHGVLSTFEAAGFDVVARPKPGTAVVALAVAD
jgi:GNAT superfamily N-acetyltransferase